MNREFIPSMNPAASVTAWEVSPCLELPDHEGGSEIQAYETFEEAESASDEAAGPVFWGVYARLSETAIAAGELPAVHIKDFDTHAKAVAFVRLMNGDATSVDCNVNNHTPGEWTVPNHICPDDIAILAGQRIVAMAVVDEDEPIDSEEQTANALLIAAAPTLLAALRWIAERDYLTQSADVIDRARAALREAQG